MSRKAIGKARSSLPSKIAGSEKIQVGSTGKNAVAKTHAASQNGGTRRNAEAIKNPTRLARLEARVPEQLNNKILRAASIKGASKTDFLIFALDEVASRVILEESTLQLHIDDQRALAEVIIADKPCPPVEKLSRLRKYGEEYSKRVERK